MTQNEPPLTLFDSFLTGEDTLWISKGAHILVRSSKRGIAPLLECIDRDDLLAPKVTIYDRVVGNAAALLMALMAPEAVYSFVGSELAAETLAHRGISYTFVHTVPHIINRRGTGMCPFEKASLGKSPAEFLAYAKEALHG